jgi:hypothetical protein
MTVMPKGEGQFEMTTWVERVQQVYAEFFKGYWQSQYRTYCQGGAGDPESFDLYRHALMSVREMAQPPGIPQPVLESYGFYHQQVEDRDCGVVTVAQVPVDNQDTFAVFVTTDGDDGWLELFDANGQDLGSARVYLELLLWGPKAAIRTMVHTGGYPVALDELQAQTLWGKTLG